MREGKKKGMRGAFNRFISACAEKIRRKGLDTRFAQALVVLALFVIFVLGAGFNYYYGIAKQLEAERIELAKQVEELTRENKDLVDLREELAEKVTILSDTIIQKVEEEEALASEQAEAHMPVGFPVSSSASVEAVEGDEMTVKLTGTAGNSFIASADGTVVSIVTDSVYEHCVTIDHENGYQTLYRNDGDVMVRDGDQVVRGAILYVIGENNTELGYEIRYDEKFIDPMTLINIDG